MFVILIINVLAVAAGVYAITYTMTYNAMMSDIKGRADGVRDYILEALTAEDVEAIGDDSGAGEQARTRVNGLLGQLRGVGNIKLLYIVKPAADGSLYTSIADPLDGGSTYIPAGKLSEDLHKSLEEGTQITGSRIYPTEHGGVYSIYWPVMDADLDVMGVVGMEFDADGVYNSYRNTAVYSLALSAALIAVFGVISYLSMSKAAEPFYTKIAYMDILTGCENRIAFEQRMYNCDAALNEEHSKDIGLTATVMVINVIGLINVNEALGHRHGDMYLKACADIIKAYLGEDSHLYRIGGAKLASILMGAQERVAEKALTGISSEDVEVLKGHPFCCACGAAAYAPGVDNSLRDAFHRADQDAAPLNI